MDALEVILDRVDVPQPKSKRAAVRQEFWVLQKRRERFAKCTFIRWLGEGGILRDRVVRKDGSAGVVEIEVVSQCDAMAGCDGCNLVLGCAEECRISD
jgi:hypothetical protein